MSSSAKTPFNVTELERFADCSSAWFFERLISPKTIDAGVDAMLRGSVAHTTLHRFYAGLPKAIGSDRVEESRLDDALAFLASASTGALDGVRMEMTRARAARARAEPAPRPRAARPRRGALAAAARPAPLRGRLRLGALGAGAPARARPRRRAHALREDRPDRRRSRQRARDRPGLQVGPDRPLGGARSRRSCGSRSRSTCSCCATSSGSSRSAASTGRSPASGGRAACSAPTREDDVLPGFVANDYLDEDAFWAQVDGARDLARGLAQRIRAGDVRHDPKGTDGCPAWCDLWRMCRVRARVSEPNEQQARGDRGPGPGLRLRRRRDREDDRPRRALRRGGLRARARRRVAARHHLHRAGGGRAAGRGSARGCASSAGTTSRARSTAPGSRPSTASACGC